MGTIQGRSHGPRRIMKFKINFSDKYNRGIITVYCVPASLLSFEDTRGGTGKDLLAIGSSTNKKSSRVTKKQLARQKMRTLRNKKY